MSFQKEPLSFRTIKVDEIPEEIAPMVQLLLQSKTIEEAILTAQNPITRSPNNAPASLSQNGFSYRALYRALQWLRDQGVLKNASIQNFIDNSQAEYIWPRSLLKLPLLETVVWKNAKALKKMTTLGFAPIALFVPIALILFGILWSLIQSAFPLLKTATGGPLPYNFMTIILAVSALRTFQAIAIAIVHELLGIPQTLKWIITPISMNLEVTDRDHPKVQVLLARVQIMIASMSPLLLSVFASRPTFLPAHPSFLFALGLWILSEFSPFTQSELTYALKDIFALTPQQKLPSFQRLHKALVVLWIVGTGAFLVLGLQGQIFPRINAFLGSTSEAVPSFFFLIFIAIVIFGIIDEILQGAGLTDESAITKLRRAFKTDTNQQSTQNFSVLAKNPTWFATLPVIQFFPPEAQTHFHSQSQLLKVRKGSKICQQGETSRDLFILLDGTLKIFRRVAGSGRDYLAQISPISVFGEMSFFLGVPRTASVIAEADSLVLRIPHSPQLPDLDTKKLMPIRNTIWALQAMSQNPTLSQLPSETLSLLLRDTTYHSFDLGHTIAIQGDLADAAFILVEGEVMVSQNGTTIRTVRKGDLIGEIALFLPSSVRTATLQAVTPVLVLKIQRDTFRNLLRNDLGLALKIEKLMLSRLEADRAR